MKQLHCQLPLDFHLVIPCFEESKRLPSYLNDLIFHLEGQPYRTNILVVDDGSSEEERKKTHEIISELRQSHHRILEPLLLRKNMGKGFAVRTGWQADRTAKWLAFVDADGATPAYDVRRIFNTIHQETNINKCFLGSRFGMSSPAVQRNWDRRLIGRIYAIFVGTFMSGKLHDSQCGFKVISQQAFQSILPYLQENRFAFDIEMISALVDSGYTIEEIPVNWKDVPGSKVSILRDSVPMLKSLFKIRARRKQWKISKNNP